MNKYIILTRKTDIMGDCESNFLQIAFVFTEQMTTVKKGNQTRDQT